jgi:hypothetical protein
MKYKKKYLFLKHKISEVDYIELINSTDIVQSGGKKKSRGKNKNLNRSINTNNNSEKEWNMNFDTYYIGVCKMSKEEKSIVRKNPHCVEFFCILSNILNCTECTNYLVNNNIFKINPFLKQAERSKSYKQINKPTNNTDNMCKKKCLDGYLYDFMIKNFNLTNIDLNIGKTQLDKYKTNQIFYNDNFTYNYSDIPNVLKYENTAPRPKNVVHWGQLKLFLTTLFFLVKYIEPSDKDVRIIYAGSAVGHNILILSEMFPNIKWYLIDPAQFAKELYTHKQVIEIRNEFFTDDSAKYYYNLLKSRDKSKVKLFFISDIRLEPTEQNVMEDNNSDARWHSIIKPDYSYLKFRCPYQGDKLYSYYDGEIFVQPYAPPGSIESRQLLSKGLKEKKYNREE